MPAQRWLTYDESDMEREDVSSLGCVTLSDLNDESIEEYLQETGRRGGGGGGEEET